MGGPGRAPNLGNSKWKLTSLKLLKAALPVDVVTVAAGFGVMTDKRCLY